MVLEEDEVGDAMYVVLSGECQVRARPERVVSSPDPQLAPPLAVAALAASSCSSTCSSTDSSDSDDDQARPASGRQATASRSEAEHTATYWIHKYMEQVTTYTRICVLCAGPLV